MQININGTAKNLPAAVNLAQLVAQCCKQPKHVITEVNGAIIPSGDWEKTSVKEGDAIELVSFVGGG